MSLHPAGLEAPPFRRRPTLRSTSGRDGVQPLLSLLRHDEDCRFRPALP